MYMASILTKCIPANMHNISRMYTYIQPEYMRNTFSSVRRKRSIVGASIKPEPEKTTVEPKTVINYMGINLDHELNFNQHISEARNKAQKIISMLYHLTCQKSVLSEKTKLLLYQL